jgi:hypothetical protein
MRMALTRMARPSPYRDAVEDGANAAACG